MFKTRLEMAKHYDELMNRTNDSRRRLRRNRQDENLIKTFLIELHSGERELRNRERLLSSLRNFASVAGASLAETSDWLFYELRGDELEFYLEVVDPRFVLVHTHESAEAASRFFLNATSSASFVDHAWLPSGFLTRLSTIGHLRGFKLRNDDALNNLKTSDEADALLRKLSLSLSLSEDAVETLNELKQVRAFRHALNVYGVELRLNEDGSKRYALDEVYFDGKVTARGTSFTAHHDFVGNLCERYGRKIREVEDNLSIKVRSNGINVTVTGAPFEIEIDPPLSNLHTFCRNLLSGAKPFRLWGVAEQVSADYVSVKAVDLHGGHRLNLEISPELIRVYIPGGTCGNTLYRLITSLQLHLTRELMVSYGGEGFDVGFN